jgi:hypothetical protein
MRAATSSVAYLHLSPFDLVGMMFCADLEGPVDQHGHSFMPTFEPVTFSITKVCLPWFIFKLRIIIVDSSMHPESIAVWNCSGM